jgi:hypothetical protein
MLNLRTRLVLRLVLGLLLVACQAAPAGVVLCVATEGHRAIEIVASARCHSYGTASEVACAERDEGCPQGCRDTPLPYGAAIRAASGVADGDISPAPCLAVDPVSVGGSSRSQVVPRSTHLPRIPDVRLRSTVLQS